MKSFGALNDILVGDVTRAKLKLKKPPQDIKDEALELLQADLVKAEKELSALRLRVLTHDKATMSWAREVRGAKEDAEALLEALSLICQTIDNSKREWRKIREQARKLLESRGIPPPSTLGSSRRREKRVRKATKTTEST
jgi:hypothetical protein